MSAARDVSDLPRMAPLPRMENYSPGQSDGCVTVRSWGFSTYEAARFAGNCLSRFLDQPEGKNWGTTRMWTTRRPARMLGPPFERRQTRLTAVAVVSQRPYAIGALIAYWGQRHGFFHNTVSLRCRRQRSVDHRHGSVRANVTTRISSHHSHSGSRSRGFRSSRSRRAAIFPHRDDHHAWLSRRRACRSQAPRCGFTEWQ